MPNLPDEECTTGPRACSQGACSQVAATQPARARHEMEHRWGNRIACHARVRLSCGAAQAGEGLIRNVSISGAFIETSLPLSPSAILQVTIRRTDGAAETTLPACVVRKEADGVAVEFSEALAGPLCPLLGCDSRCESARRAGY
jgi:hypothetical protein